ncbi:AAA ATPase [Bacillus phage PK-3]|nr:AAA ATPase [Bacillus phage PK-3]
MMELRIKPRKAIFFNEESFFGIYAVDVNPDDLDKGVELNHYGNISIKGVMPKLNTMEEYIVTVKPDTQSNYDGSYIVESIKQDKPVTVSDQKAFLSTILTSNQIENIFAVYKDGEDIVGMIENGEFDYKSVKGLGDKSFEKLKKKVMDNIDMGEVLAFCNKHNIKYNTIAKLVKEYKNPTIVVDKINQNPYVLTEVPGIGFKKADEIAKAVGYSMTSKNRIDSALRYIISLENMSGHSWISRKPLLNRAIELLNISKEHIITVLDNDTKGIKNVDGERYTRDAVYEAEQFVAQRMIQYKTQSKKLFETDELDRFLDEYCERNNVELEENQRNFFHDWNENSILFLVGGGGMGKSWLQRILLELIDKKNLTTALLAPTGKASKVMKGYTGREASTIHRKAGVFGDGEEAINDIYEDVIIVDESSMCDVFILSKFFKALSNDNARILFVGDDFQLPSVGVGNFLYDSIHSLCIKISTLKKVFRQEEGGILDISTKVRNGQVFLNDDAEGRIVFGKDCVFWLTEQQYIKDGVITNYKKVSKKFDADDIVILTPTNKGTLGTISLNKEIQKIANPPLDNKKEKTFGKDNQVTFRVGDAVMNVVNTYGIETVDGGMADVFNGDTGKIVDIDESEKLFIVDFDGIKVKMKFNTVLTNLVHSWVTTIHKSQGSQYKVVIVIIDKSMKYQLNANLIYTGFSRAKQFMLVLGQAEAINHGIKKFANMERRSFLNEMLNEFNNSSVDPVADYKEETPLFEDDEVEESPIEKLYM